ncbi:hypothetical protein AMR42_10880 [Limnothrix sp. PR1529]|nr:hypothetical protein BCR12_11580 [Limnothrix sp. P13C2]PIB10060.1 hypothetical protein AMR42_10880 [Limnothrix sp. PR1529]
MVLGLFHQDLKVSEFIFNKQNHIQALITTKMKIQTLLEMLTDSQAILVIENLMPFSQDQFSNTWQCLGGLR